MSTTRFMTGLLALLLATSGAAMAQGALDASAAVDAASDLAVADTASASGAGSAAAGLVASPDGAAGTAAGALSGAAATDAASAAATVTATGSADVDAQGALGETTVLVADVGAEATAHAESAAAGDDAVGIVGWIQARLGAFVTAIRSAVGFEVDASAGAAAGVTPDGLGLPDTGIALPESVSVERDLGIGSSDLPELGETPSLPALPL